MIDIIDIFQPIALKGSCNIEAHFNLYDIGDLN